MGTQRVIEEKDYQKLLYYRAAVKVLQEYIEKESTEEFYKSARRVLAYIDNSLQRIEEENN